MLGLSAKRTAADRIYLANAPYVRWRTPTEDPLFVDASFSEIQKQFVAQIIRWCIERSLIKQKDNHLYPDLDKNVGSLSHIIYIQNFQYLVYRDTLEEFLKLINDNQSYHHFTAFQQLAISLMGLYEPNFIHYHINRIYRAFDAFPMTMQDFTWADLHQRYPFLWVILTVHLVATNYTEKE